MFFSQLGLGILCNWWLYFFFFFFFFVHVVFIANICLLTDFADLELHYVDNIGTKTRSKSQKRLVETQLNQNSGEKFETNWITGQVDSSIHQR